jgi:hypothetical protein
MTFTFIAGKCFKNKGRIHKTNKLPYLISVQSFSEHFVIFVLHSKVEEDTAKNHHIFLETNTKKRIWNLQNIYVKKFLITLKK